MSDERKLVLYYVSASPSCRAAYLVARELDIDVELKWEFF